MLKELFPRAHGRYRSLPLLGPVLDDFAAWLLDHGYRRRTVRVMFRPLVRVDRSLRRRGVQRVSDLDVDVMESCWSAFHRRGPRFAGLVRVLRRYLDAKGLLRQKRRESPTPAEKLVAAYGDELDRLRGASASTICNHRRTARDFLAHVGHDRLGTLGSTEIESFVVARASKLTRTSLQQVVAQLRGFLRFLASRHEVAFDLDKLIDTPRVYRQEQLPRSLPWETVCALLQSIDRNTPLGLRDYTMLFLVAAYGLRVGEVAALRLDHIHWRAGRLRVPCRKVDHPLVLPLTDSVASTLLDYLREGRPADAPSRELFLRSRAPAGPLTSSAVTMVFERRARRSGLQIPYFGAHCVRHSYAVHLLRSGTSLKTIGDLLGHRNAESTSVYLRLATEELRGVALSLPAVTANEEVRS